MKKTILKGICQTLILIIAIILFGTTFLMALMETFEEGLPEESPGQTAEETWSDPGDEAEPAEAETDSYGRIMRILINNPWMTQALFVCLFGLIALTLLLDALPLRNGGQIFRNITIIRALLYLSCGFPFLILGYTETAVAFMNVLCSVALAWEAMDKLRAGFSKRALAARILLLILLLLNLIFLMTDCTVVLVLVILRSFVQIMRMAFSQVRLDVLGKIIRKTYAAEILFGLVLLMVAFSLLLSLVDGNMTEFSDALWFCFATVTTIGYGDISASSPISRILSVILGVYGIIVVALITSIIVNFYNEMKSAKEEDPGRPETEIKGIEEGKIP